MASIDDFLSPMCRTSSMFSDLYKSSPILDLYKANGPLFDLCNTGPLIDLYKARRLLFDFYNAGPALDLYRSSRMFDHLYASNHMTASMRSLYEPFKNVQTYIQSMAPSNFAALTAGMYKNYPAQFTGFLDTISTPDYSIDTAEDDFEDSIPSPGTTRVNIRTKFTGSVRNVLSLTQIKDCAIEGICRAYLGIHSETGTKTIHFLAAAAIESVKVYSNLDPTSAMIVGGLGLIAGAPTLVPIPGDAMRDNTTDK